MSLRRQPGSQWGNPNAPRFNYGPKEWTPWNQDLNWRAQCQKENDELDARAEVLDEGEGLMALVTGGLQNKRNKERKKEKEMSKVVELERTMKAELERITKSLNDGLEAERQAREIAEKKAAAERRERLRMEKQLLALKARRRRGGGSSVLSTSRSATSLAGSSVVSGSGYSSLSRSTAASKRSRAYAKRAHRGGGGGPALSTVRSTGESYYE